MEKQWFQKTFLWFPTSVSTMETRLNDFYILECIAVKFMYIFADLIYLQLVKNARNGIYILIYGGLVA